MALPPSSMRQDFSIKPRVHRAASLANPLALWTPCLCHTRLQLWAGHHPHSVHTFWESDQSPHACMVSDHQDISPGPQRSILTAKFSSSSTVCFLTGGEPSLGKNSVCNLLWACPTASIKKRLWRRHLIKQG